MTGLAFRVVGALETDSGVEALKTRCVTRTRVQSFRPPVTFLPGKDAWGHGTFELVVKLIGKSLESAGLVGL
jgi:hypothetical protein